MKLILILIPLMILNLYGDMDLNFPKQFAEMTIEDLRESLDIEFEECMKEDHNQGQEILCYVENEAKWKEMMEIIETFIILQMDLLHKQKAKEEYLKNKEVYQKMFESSGIVLGMSLEESTDTERIIFSYKFSKQVIVDRAKYLLLLNKTLNQQMEKLDEEEINSTLDSLMDNYNKNGE